MADGFWVMQIAVTDEVVRRYHELTEEDPETNPGEVSDWLSDLVHDAVNAGLTPATETELLFCRGVTPLNGDESDENFILLGSRRVDDIHAAYAASNANDDDTGPNEDGS